MARTYAGIAISKSPKQQKQIIFNIAPKKTYEGEGDDRLESGGHDCGVGPFRVHDNRQKWEELRTNEA